MTPETKLNRPRFERLLSSFMLEMKNKDEPHALGEPDLAVALLRDAWRTNASDIHLDPEYNELNIRMRIDGVIHDTTRVDMTTGRKLLNQFKAMARINPGTTLTIEEGRFSHTIDNRGLDLRVVSVPCISGPKLAIRLLIQRQVEEQLDHLGLRQEQIDQIEAWLEKMTGMFLAAGPTGSGKTTTLYALLHKLKHFESNIVTIEDPIEYSIAGVNQIQVDKAHGLDFAAGGRALLRLDPDCLLIGEIRDSASAESAHIAASRGSMLLSTIHSHEAVGAVAVLKNYGLSSQDISTTLSLIIAQRLVRALCPVCRREEKLHEHDRSWFAALEIRPPENAWYPKGCDECNDLGYQGRTGIFELWHLQDDHYGMILNDMDVFSIRKKLREQGHKSLLDEALLKLKQGMISPREIRVISGYGPVARKEEAGLLEPRGEQ